MDDNHTPDALPPLPPLPLWRQLFDAAVAQHGPVKLAIQLGYSNHTLVSLVANGKKPASAEFQARVLNRLHIVPECPATGLEQPRAHCQQIAHAPAPTHNPLAMRTWKACQSCPHKPEKE